MAKPSPISTIKAAAKDFGAEDCAGSAAALSFYAITAIPPLVVLLTAILGLVYSDARASQELVTQVTAMFGASTGETIGSILERKADSSHGAAAITGLLVLLVGASGFFVQLQKALNKVWGVEPDPQAGWKGFIFKRILSMSVVLGTGFLLLISLVMSAFISAMSRWLETRLGLNVGLAQLAEATITLAMITGLFALLFKYLPDVHLSWGDTWRGALATAILFLVGKFALGWYLGRHDFSADYGSAGALVLILFWVYYTSMIMLFGAELTEAHAEARGAVIEPEGHARRVRKTADGDTAPVAATPTKAAATRTTGSAYQANPVRGGGRAKA